MDPDLAMTWCILSTDPAFVAAMEALLGAAGQEVTQPQPGTSMTGCSRRARCSRGWCWTRWGGWT